MEKRRVRHTDRFVETALQSDTDECVVWPYAVTGYGYATSRGGLVHRTVCTQKWGEPPEGKPFACHSCGVKACVNPRHIYWGSPQDNSDDATRLGERSVGEAHGAAKLAADQIGIIRSSAETSRALGKRFGVSHTTIEQIKNRKLWRNVA